MTTPPHQRLGQLRRRFLAANMRSRSLRLTRMTRAGALDLHQLESVAPLALQAVLRTMGQESSPPLPLVPTQAPTGNEAAAQLAADLAALERAARATWMETGADELALGWPLLEGRTHDGTWLRGPLLVYPVSLDRSRKGLEQWTLTLTGYPDLNVGLAQALWRELRVRLTIDDILDHDDDRVMAVDPPTWEGLWRCLTALGMPMAPPSGILPALRPVPARLRDAQETLPEGTFALHHHLVLGRFPRSGSSVVLDYDQLLTLPEGSPLALAGDLLAVDEDAPWQESAPLEDQAQGHDPGRDGRRWQVLSSDSSQDAVFGFLDQPGSRGLVVQGPPGTGKSQMITNLVASAIARQQRVLLVCQKRAALDVVADRLASVGLREPVAVVHDVQHDRNPVCDALAESLERALATANPEAAALDHQLQQAEREHTAARARLDGHLSAAQTAWSALAGHQHQRPGLATLQERALDDDGRPLPDLTDAAQSATEAQLYEALPRLASLVHDAEPLASPHPLAARTRWPDLDDAGANALTRPIEALIALLEKLDAPVPSGLTPDEARKLASAFDKARPVLDLIEGHDPDALDELLLFWIWTGGDTSSGAWASVMETLRRGRAELKPTPPELVVAPRAQLEAWRADLARLAQLDARWYRPFVPEWWRLRKVPGAVLDACPSLQANPAGAALVNVPELVERALAWHTFIASLPSDNPVLKLGFQGDLEDIDTEIEGLKAQHDRVRAVHRLHEALRDLGGPYAALPELDPTEDPAELPFFAAALADRRRAAWLTEVEPQLKALEGRWEPLLIEAARQAAASGRCQGVIDHLRQLLSVKEDFPRAARLDRLLKHEPRWVRDFLRGWRRREGELPDPATDATLALERAWRALARQGRTAAAVEAPLVDRALMTRFAQDVDRCQSVAGRGVLAAWFGWLVKAAADPGRSRAMRQLAGEARKKRRRLTLRQLVEQHWDGALSLTRPAWFCSPDSVAALFPLEIGMFDLVIFDEASQCPVESAVPTLARARRAIVAGDDQQMPPSHFFRATDDDEDDDEESAVLASRSLLGLARVAFPDTTLRWHYRSRHEELVAFSNAAFYGGRLITAPRRESIADPIIEGLNWRQLGGLWQDQRNEVEADAVVALVTDLLGRRAPHGQPPSIGVVTFNRKQAELIEERLEATARIGPLGELLALDRQRPAVEQLFVRNLENVQGDERDVIIFSIGYGPNTPGGRVHARFGPLGQEGGEKRLNVAVTRARLGVWVLCSFDPDRLDVDKARNKGPQLLKRYLQFVRARAQAQATRQEELLAEAAELGGGQGVTGAHRVALATHRVGHRVRDELATLLEAEGWRVQRGLGLGSQRLDLAIGVHGEEGWRLGVDCSEFLANADPMARDVYTPRFWERLGWQVTRVTPAMWLHRRHDTLAALRASLGEPRR